MKLGVLFLAPILSMPQVASPPLGPASTAWIREVKTDSFSFSGGQYTEYSLSGKFLDAPQNSGLTAPVLVLRCLPGTKGIGYHLSKGGQFGSARIAVGALLTQHSDGIYGMYRRDDGKPQLATFTPGTAGNAFFFSESQSEEMFFGHLGWHKENSSPPVSKLVIAVDESGAARIVMQFDLDGVSDVADSCGLIAHKRS